MSIEIKSRYGGRVLFTAENAQGVRQAVVEAVAADANLRGAYLSDAYLSDAYLRDANLRGANLRGANLRGANLRGANLSGAYLSDAYLRGANLRGANLSGAYLSDAYLSDAYLSDANLRGANLRGAYLSDAYLSDAYLSDANLRLEDAGDWSHPLWATRQDVWSILDHAPAEVAALRDAMVAGKINGSTYNDETGCGCLCGTIAIQRECELDGLLGIGIKVDGSRPAERWFISIQKGDTPLPVETAEWPNESTFRLSWALKWLDEWVESRRAISKFAEILPDPEQVA